MEAPDTLIWRPASKHTVRQERRGVKKSKKQVLLCLLLFSEASVVWRMLSNVEDATIKRNRQVTDKESDVNKIVIHKNVDYCHLCPGREAGTGSVTERGLSRCAEQQEQQSGRESGMQKAGRARAVTWEKGKRWGWKGRQAFVDHRSKVAQKRIVVGED